MPTYVYSAYPPFFDGIKDGIKIGILKPEILRFNATSTRIPVLKLKGSLNEQRHFFVYLVEPAVRCW